MQSSNFVRLAGLWCIIGALLGIGCGIREGLFPTTWGTAEFVIMQLLVFVANALTMVGVIGFARSGAAGESRLAKVGLGLAILGGALFLPFELYIIANFELGGMMLLVSTLLQALGLLLAGIPTLRIGRWQGWSRFLPLLCGLYPFLVIIPVFGMSDGYNAWVLVGWQILYVLLGLALYQQGVTTSTETIAVGA